MQRITADQLVLPIFIVSIELNTSFLITFSQFLFYVREQMSLPIGAFFLRGSPSSAFDDVDNAGFGDDLVALKWQHGHFAPIPLASPKEYRIGSRIHVHHYRPVVFIREFPHFKGLAPPIVHG